MYTRLLTLRTCGYFSTVKSDYGTEYKTLEFVSAEALYASLTRGRTRKFGYITEKMDNDFLKWYDVGKEPIWFLPGIFNMPFRKSEHVFNVIDELKPSTNKYSIYKKGEWKLAKRNLLPTFGTIETIQPNQLFITWALSNKKSLLESYNYNQVFLLGKKRTMVQIIDVSEIGLLEKVEGELETWPLPLQIADFNKFQAYEILWHTPKYIIAKGVTKHPVAIKVLVNGEERNLILPEWWVEKMMSVF